MTNEVTENNETDLNESTPVSDTKEETKQNADLNISDLIALKNILEVASTRGAFKAVEFEAVGKTFNKLNAFLEAVSSNQKET